jgi:lauroyl/myristoyl acyltransferase
VNGAVIASAHVGNWELLLGLSQLFKDVMPVMFLVEASFNPAVNRFLAEVRGSGGGESASRKGGAAALVAHVRKGGAAGLVVDRNIRQSKGGIWAPFFGLSALTTPLPAQLARGHGVPCVMIFCLPTGDGRYRIEVGPDCARDVRSDDRAADILEITTRLNRQVEEKIRERPESWNWTLKRFKSRPTEERGAYPPYSRFERPET